MQTLSAFLSSIALEQYHAAFLEAGATDEDLSQLVAFNDTELSEFLSALDMLPFHSIKFKKCLRELKPPPLTELPSTREFILSHATIYGKKKNRPLTSYEEAINRASLDLALENPVLISKKGRLFDMAKQKLLDSGYHYKRGSSRSKLKSQAVHPAGCSEKLMLAKREENAQRMSDHRLAKMEQLQIQVDYALQSRQRIENQLAATADSGFSSHQRHIALKTDLARFEDIKIKLSKELSQLKAQERKHQWYKRRKLEKHNLSQDEGFSSQTSQEEEEEEAHPSAFTAFISSQESTSSVMTCSRTSDVRASSISDYDR
ncbi:uncharacterized protein EV154DRAFT_579504 [Mucor mucedo]|uniref:uncharacterized protein n=1 Tax=Mucor mucedo TaxID=29922 RepID=UPI00221E725A|nr:uncharacterized protein EV154DRAFT_579504 [Mucor mucedo]KAI7873141.1 hypothetical protein EV154DRAFT_579504 [Mucor mucedo]